MKSRFGEALAMCGIEYRIDPIARAAIESRERELGLRLPAAFVEWYAMHDGIALLRKHSNCDAPLEISELGDLKRTSWANAHSDQILIFMVENQGVCLWGLRLDAGDDPPVVVAVDPDFKWRANVDRFSTFVTCQIWDHARVFGGHVVAAQANPLAPRDVEALRAHFPERSKTSGWPGDDAFRFERGEDRLLIWNGDSQADWWISSSTEQGLAGLLREVFSCCKIEGSVYGIDDQAIAVVNAFRA